jgi:predicted nucleotidyltransferase
MRIRQRAPEILGTKVDVMPRGGIHPMIRDEVIAEAVQVF